MWSPRAALALRGWRGAELDRRAEACRVLSIPATRIAEEVGRTLVANIVMLGFLAAVTNLVSEEAMLEAALTSVPEKTIPLNRKAFQAGLDFGRELLSEEAAA